MKRNKKTLNKNGRFQRNTYFANATCWLPFRASIWYGCFIFSSVEACFGDCWPILGFRIGIIICTISLVVYHACFLIGHYQYLTRQKSGCMQVKWHLHANGWEYLYIATAQEVRCTVITSCLRLNLMSFLYRKTVALSTAMVWIALFDECTSCTFHVRN